MTIARPQGKEGLQAILFDLDGTLVDTELAASRVIQETFRAWGSPIDPRDAEYLTGRTWAMAFDFLFAKYQVPVPHDEAARTVLDSYKSALERELPRVPGSAQAVRCLAARYPLALVSGSNRREILFALGELGVLGLFQVVLGAEDYPRSKPAPDGYAKAMQLLGVEPDRTLVFEDSQPGIESALAAGARVVAITGTNHFAQDTVRAHHHISDLACVDLDWLEKLWLRLA